MDVYFLLVSDFMSIHVNAKFPVMFIGRIFE